MIYFDNSATTKPYDEVLDSFVRVASQYYGNPSSLHSLGGQAEMLLSQARDQIAGILGVSAKEVYFTSGGTESNNLAIKGAAMMYKERGRHLITTKIEHPSVKAAMEQLEKMGFEVTYLNVDEHGLVKAKDIRKSIRQDTILVSVMHVNNEVGTIQPIEEIGELLKEFPKVLFHVDYIQGIGKVPLTFTKSQIDLCSISGHKIHGLKGTGLLYIRDGIQISPLFSGGSQEKMIRSGTENVPGMVAMAKAMRLVYEKNRSDLDRMLAINKKLREGLMSMPEISINTPIENSAPHILNFSLDGIKSEVFIHSLEQEQIFVSTTSACSSKRRRPSSTLLAMGIPEALASSSIRISLSYDNTLEEADIVLSSIEKAVNQLRRVYK